MANIGISYPNKGDHRTALNHFKEARQVDLDHPGKIKPGYALLNLMLCHFNLDEHLEALDLGLQCLTILEQNKVSTSQKIDHGEAAEEWR